jgi:CHAT domain-containing protein
LEPEVSKLSDAFLAILFYASLGDAQYQLGDFVAAEPSLRSAISLAESHLRSLSDDKSRVEWNQRASIAYREYTQLQLHQGKSLEALEIWELYRGATPRAQSAGRSPLLAGTQPPIQPSEVTSRLPSLTTETVVSYALLPKGLAVWVYDNRGVFVHWTEGDPSDIAAQAARFRRLCSDPASDSSILKQDARALYDLLVAPVEERLSPGRGLAIELDDRLSGLPLEALIDRQGRYLSEQEPIVLSLGIYYRRDARALVPITEDSPALVASVPSSSAIDGASFVPLLDADSEGEMVAHAFRSAQILSAQDATASAVIAHLPSAVVFHFAGHAFNSQQRSGLLLSDALLSAASLRSVSLSRMRLAVFSACDTQGGSNGGVYDSDSLVRVFLRAGVPEAVATRWSVDSAATHQFMDMFYHALLNGSNAADAIRQAQSGLRSRRGMEHPYYWSAFTSFRLI